MDLILILTIQRCIQYLEIHIRFIEENINDVNIVYLVYVIDFVVYRYSDLSPPIDDLPFLLNF